MDGSFAQEGINPQTKKSARFVPSFGRARMGWEGAILKRGAAWAGMLNSGNAS
jgi:hypothetical protein